MEFKQLQSYITVVEQRNFTKAAELLFISQPTISIHIRSLEDELGEKLIYRTTKSIDITPKGMEFYECAKSIIQLKDNLLQRWNNKNQDILHLGASTIPSAYILPEILPAFGEKYPECYFVINQSDSMQIIEGVSNGNYDIGMIGMPVNDEKIASIPFYQDHMVLITPVTPHFLHLKNSKNINYNALLQEPIILRESGSGSKKSADQFLDLLGIKEKDMNIVARINDQESIKNLVAGGLGISFISERAAQNFIDEKRLLSFQLPKNISGRQLYIIYRKNMQLRNTIKAFIDYTLFFFK